MRARQSDIFYGSRRLLPYENAEFNVDFTEDVLTDVIITGFNVGRIVYFSSSHTTSEYA